MYLMYTLDTVEICLEGYEFRQCIYIEDGHYKTISHHADAPAQLSVYFKRVFLFIRYYSPSVILYAC